MRDDPLFSQVPVGVIELDHSGRVMEVNPAGCRALCRSEETVQGATLLEWIHPSDRGAVHDRLDLVVGGEAQEWHARIRRGDGLPRLHTFLGVPVSSPAGAGRVLLFLQEGEEDRPGRPETGQLLRFLETLPGQFILSADKDGKVRYASGLERTHFMDSASALGNHYREFLGGEREGEESLEELLEAVGEGRPWAGLQWHRRKDGPSFPARIFAAPYRDPRTGHVLGMMLVGQDDTPAHRWRDQAERAEPLAQIGSLSTGIAKKIADSLADLEGSVSRLGLLAGETLEEGAAIRGGIAHFRRFLEAVAEFGNRGTLRRCPFPFPDLLHEVMDDFRARLESMGLQPEVELASDLSPVYADRAYLRRILEILLENALDAMEGTPDPFFHLELSNGRDGVLLRVTNSSAVLPLEWLEEIFDPFFTTKLGRPGLGLAVAQGMVRAHDGRLWAEMPEPGRLRLSMELPREAPDRVREYRPVPLNLSRSRRVLLVDDNEGGRQTTRAFLQKLGYEVQEAWSVRSALAQITNGQLPEVVVSDLRVSDGSSAWFLEEVGRLSPRLLSRTVLLAEDPEFEESESLSRRVGCPLLRKPIQPGLLLETLDGILGGG